MHEHSRREHGRRFARGRGPDHRHDHGPDHGPDHGHDHGHAAGHGRHGGGRRLFDHGELRLVVLALIAERPRHGYEIIKEVEDRAGRSYSPSPGVIYPTLTLLEELGQASVVERDNRRLYAATAGGIAHLAANQPALDRALDRLRSAGVAHGAGGAPEVVRASENLKLALRLRLGCGPLTGEQARAIAEALDAAAVAVERS